MTPDRSRIARTIKPCTPGALLKSLMKLLVFESSALPKELLANQNMKYGTCLSAVSGNICDMFATLLKHLSSGTRAPQVLCTA